MLDHYKASNSPLEAFLFQPQEAIQEAILNNVITGAFGLKDKLAEEAERHRTYVLNLPAPPDLSDRAREHWEELVPDLIQRRIITSLDKDVLQIYCEAFSAWLEVDQQLKTVGYTQMTANGYEQNTATYNVWRELIGTVLKLARNLGLTPPSRIALKSPNPTQADLFDADNL